MPSGGPARSKSIKPPLHSAAPGVLMSAPAAVGTAKPGLGRATPRRGVDDPSAIYHRNRPCGAGARGKRPPAALRRAAMTSIDHFAIATEILGKQCIKLSRPPHDVRFGNPHGLVSVDCTTGRWRTTVQIRVGGKTVEMSGHYLKELSEIKKKNGGGDCGTILEEAARQAIAGAEAQEAADEGYEAALGANRSEIGRASGRGRGWGRGG